MPDSLYFFIDENFDELVQENDSISTQAMDNEYEQVISRLYSSSICSADHSAPSAADAHWRLKAAAIIQKAILRNDDVTLTRWFQGEMFTDSNLLSEAELKRAQVALMRKKILLAIRDNEMPVNKDVAKFLEGSNLLTSLDKLKIFSSISR